MNPRLIVPCVCVVLMTAGGSWAGDIVEASARVVPAAATAAVAVGAVGNEAPVGPWMHPKFSRRPWREFLNNGQHRRRCCPILISLI